MGRKVLVLVLTIDKEPWRTIEYRGQRDTWAGIANDDTAILWLHGVLGGTVRFLTLAAGKLISVTLSERAAVRYRARVGAWMANRKVRSEGDRLLTSVPESYLNTNPKTLAAFKHVLKSCDFDYVLRTNTSTYVNTHILEEFVAELPAKGYYGGFEGFKDGISFASGTGILLSRDMLEVIVNDKEWDYHLIDDVAIGRSMKRSGIKLRPIARIDVSSSEDVASLNSQFLREVFLVRCKGSDGREHDVAAMHQVHKIYGDAGLI